MIKYKLRISLGYLFTTTYFILMIVSLEGCAALKVKEAPTSIPKVEARTFPDCVAVIAQEGDTLSSLSAKYLNDPPWIGGLPNITTLKSLNLANP